MNKVIAVCDENHNHTTESANVVYEKWFTLSYPETKNTRRTLNFCSLECLNSFLKRVERER